MPAATPAKAHPWRPQFGYKSTTLEKPGKSEVMGAHYAHASCFDDPPQTRKYAVAAPCNHQISQTGIFPTICREGPMSRGARTPFQIPSVLHRSGASPYDSCVFFQNKIFPDASPRKKRLFDLSLAKKQDLFPIRIFRRWWNRPSVSKVTHTPREPVGLEKSLGCLGRLDG